MIGTSEQQDTSLLPTEALLLARPSPTKPNRTIDCPSGVSLKYLSGLANSKPQHGMFNKCAGQVIDHMQTKAAHSVSLSAIRRGERGPSKQNAYSAGEETSAFDFAFHTYQKAL